MRKRTIHGQLYRITDRQLLSEKDTFLWLSRGDLKTDTEIEIIAAQDKTFETKHSIMQEK